MIISVINHKNSSGKSTTSVNLAAALSYGSPESILLIDFDPQSSSSHWLGIKNSEFNIYKSIQSKEELKPIAINGNINLIPANLDLSKMEYEQNSVEGRELALKQIIEKDNIHKRFNYIIIDCPSNLGLLTLNAIVASNELIVPISMRTNYAQITGTIKNFTDIIRTKYNPNLAAPWHLPNYYDKNLKSDLGALEVLKKEKCFKSIIHKDNSFSESYSKNKTIIEFNSTCSGAIDFFKLAKEVRGL